MSKRKKGYSGNEGMTLVEVLLSLVILTMVLLSFSTFFIQSARTNQQAEAVIDATYAAQACIEKATEINTHMSTWAAAVEKIKSDLGFNDITSLSLSTEPLTAEENKVILAGSYESYYVEMQLYEKKNGKTVVEVFNDTNKTKLLAKMETRLPWEE